MQWHKHNVIQITVALAFVMLSTAEIGEKKKSRKLSDGGSEDAAPSARRRAIADEEIDPIIVPMKIPKLSKAEKFALIIESGQNPFEKRRHRLGRRKGRRRSRHLFTYDSTEIDNFFIDRSRRNRHQEFTTAPSVDQVWGTWTEPSLTDQWFQPTESPDTTSVQKSYSEADFDGQQTMDDLGDSRRPESTFDHQEQMHESPVTTKSVDTHRRHQGFFNHEHLSNDQESMTDEHLSRDQKSVNHEHPSSGWEFNDRDHLTPQQEYTDRDQVLTSEAKSHELLSGDDNPNVRASTNEKFDGQDLDVSATDDQEVTTLASTNSEPIWRRSHAFLTTAPSMKPMALPMTKCPHRFDAITRAFNGRTYVFARDRVYQVWRFDNLHQKASFYVNEMFPNGPRTVTVAYTNRRSGVTILIEHKTIYRYRWDRINKVFYLARKSPQALTAKLAVYPRAGFQWIDGNQVLMESSMANMSVYEFKGEQFSTYDAYWNVQTFTGRTTDYFPQFPHDLIGMVYHGHKLFILYTASNKIQIYDTSKYRVLQEYPIDIGDYVGCVNK